MRFAVMALSLVAVGCQVAPTKVSTQRARPEFEQIIAKTEKPLALSELAVVLDVRSQFDFGLNHVLNSYHFPWSNLAEQEASGQLLRDPSRAVLRLALIGVTPTTPIVIVGYGQAGKGEEGRLAWNLLHLGFRDVQTAAIETFRSQMTQNPSPVAQNVPTWKPSPVEEMQIGKSEFLTLAKDPKGRIENKIHILDVRSPQEYLKSKHPDFQALNIEWRQFYTAKGRPNLAFKAKLAALNILPSHRVVIVSDRGVRSAAASYALLAMGFDRVQSFTSGFNSL